MEELLPPPKRKTHTVVIQGQEIEVTLEKKLQVQRAGEYAFILDNGEIVPKPKKKNKLQCKVLVKTDMGGHFYDGDPFWIEKISEEGYAWQIESE
tara:strand:+ start:4294 stop:4578 length:285 start_codon:yes stop_codon:yes gene_type:complete